MSAPALYLTNQQRSALDAGFVAAFGAAPERYFSAPAVRRSAATTPTISMAGSWPPP